MPKSAAEIAKSIPPDLRTPVGGGRRVRDDLFHWNIFIPDHGGYSHISELGLPPEEADKLADDVAKRLMEIPHLHVVMPELDPEIPRGEY